MHKFLFPPTRRTALGASLALVTLAALATLAIAADFGAPSLLCFIILLWCGTLGLPTTLAALTTLSLWGHWEPCFGFAPFLVVTTAAALTAQIATLNLLPRVNRNPLP